MQCHIWGMAHLMAYNWLSTHYSDVIMGAMESQITSFTTVYSTVYSGADQRNISAGNNPNSPFLQNEKGFHICFMHRFPSLITIYLVRIYRRVIQIPQRFNAECLSSLDYNPDTTSDLSAHLWYIIFPTQFIVNNHTQDFWFKNLSDGLSINL